MGNKICPSCKKTILVKKHSYYKCKKCGYREKQGISPVREKKFETTKEGIPKLSSKDIPELQEPKREELSFKFFPKKATSKQEENLWYRNEQLKKARKAYGIQKMLKKLRKHKYSGLKGKKINVQGELYEV